MNIYAKENLTGQNDIQEHIGLTQDCFNGKGKHPGIMIISKASYKTKSENLSYREKKIFALMCDKDSKNQCFSIG